MLHFHAPELVFADKLSKVSETFKNEGNELGQAGSFPPKKIREIYQLIKEGDVSGISLVEWGGLFRDDPFWKHNVQANEIDDVILTIFSEVESNADLRSLVIINAVMTIEGASNWLPNVIMNRFYLLTNSLQGKDLLCFKLINALNKGDYDGLTKSLVDADATPSELLDYLSWPKFIVMRDSLETSIIERFTLDLALQHEVMVGRLFYQFSGGLLVRLIDAYVLKLGNQPYPQYHFEWLKENVGPGIEGDIWSRIKPNTRKVLAGVLNINNFPIFYSLIKDLSVSCPGLFNIWTSKGEGQSCHERAVHRMAFWSNYTESMITSKLLLGSELHRAGELKMPSAQTQLLGLEQEEGLKTNWIILEFEKVIIIDQLTISYGAARIFNKTLLNESKLLENSKLSSNNIVLSIQDDLHDHMRLWQSSLEDCLRTKYLITPNPGTKRFEGINISYTEGVGLKPAPQDQLNSRVYEVERWERSIIESEMSLGKYETEDALDGLIQSRLSVMFKNNQSAVAVSELRKHCGSNRRWAYEMLSTHMLTKSNGSPSDRAEGQKLYNEMVSRWGP
jgi:hypothetical protein